MKRSTSAKSTISSNLRSISRPPHAEDRAVQEDVLAAGQLGVEAGADLEQRPDAAAQHRPARSVGGGDPREDLQQRALAGAVAADDADHLALLRPRRRRRAAPRTSSAGVRRRRADGPTRSRSVSRQRARSRRRRCAERGSACRGPRPGSTTSALTRRPRRALGPAEVDDRRHEQRSDATAAETATSPAGGAGVPSSAQRNPSTTVDHRVERVDVLPGARRPACRGRRRGSRTARSASSNGTTSGRRGTGRSARRAACPTPRAVTIAEQQEQRAAGPTCPVGLAP